MLRYSLRRLGAGLLMLYCLATVTFVAMHCVPGDPISNSKTLSAGIRSDLERYYGLDQPLMTQYGTFLSNLARGSFGLSFIQPKRSVNDIIEEHFAASAQVGLIALAFATIGGILLGSLIARLHRTPTAHALAGLVVLAMSIPSFVLAAVAQQAMLRVNSVAGVVLLPIAGWGGIRYSILPGLVLGMGTLCVLARFFATSLIAVGEQDHIRAAKARGLHPLRIFIHHQLRNASLPVIGAFAPTITALISGSFVVESAFSIPGLGRFFMQAVQRLDYTMIMGLTVFYGAVLLLMVTLGDVLHAWLDPRVALHRRAS
jgi:ABC-type dipeptide/oligopeptide/nickel transport system permease component